MKELIYLAKSLNSEKSAEIATQSNIQLNREETGENPCQPNGEYLNFKQLNNIIKLK